MSCSTTYYITSHYLILSYTMLCYIVLYYTTSYWERESHILLSFKLSFSHVIGGHKLVLPHVFLCVWVCACVSLCMCSTLFVSPPLSLDVISIVFSHLIPFMSRALSFSETPSALSIRSGWVCLPSSIHSLLAIALRPHASVC